MSWKGEVKWRKCVGKKQQVVATALLTNLCNTYYSSLCSKRSDYTARPLFFWQGGGPRFNLTTAPLHQGVTEMLKGSCGILKQFPRLVKTFLGSVMS